MPEQLLGEVAYGTYARVLVEAGMGRPRSWQMLSTTQRLAWGAAVQAAVQAAHEVPCALEIVPSRRKATRRWSRKPPQVSDPLVQAVMRLAREGVSRGEICARLHISAATYHRYRLLEKRAEGAA